MFVHKRSIAAAAMLALVAPVYASVPTALSSSSQATSMMDLQKDAMLMTTQLDLTRGQNDSAADARIDADVAAYKAAVERLTSDHYEVIPAMQRAVFLEGLATYFQMSLPEVDTAIANAKSVFENTTLAEAAFDQLLALDTTMFAASSLFPDDPRYAQAQEKVGAAMTELGGTRDAARAAGEALQEEKARAVQVPPATMRDANIERMFRAAFATGGWSEELLVINIRSGWRYVYSASGRIVGRRRDAAIVGRNPQTGRCNLYDYTLVQSGDGSNWGDVRRSSHSTTRIACENVKR